MPTLDLTADAVTLTEQLVNIESVSRDEQAIADAVEAALRALAAPHRHPPRQHHRRAHRPRSRASASSSPATSTRSRSTTTCPARREGDAAARPRHLRHEGRRRGHPAPRRDRARAQPRRHLHPLRGRGDRRRAQRPLPARPERPRADGRRLRDPDGAVQRRRRGRLPGHPPRRGPYDGGARPLRAQLARRQRHPRAGEVLRRLEDVRRPHARSSTGWSTTRASTRSSSAAASPATCCPTSASSRSTSASPPTAPRREAEAFVREFFDGYDVTLTDSAPGALPGLAVPAAKAFVDLVGGDVDPKFGWTDVARFSAPRHPGRQLRTGRPDARPQAGGARARGAHRALRGAADQVADVVKSKRKGPVLQRRNQVDTGTTDQRLLDSRGQTDWVHTDPWRVLRIQAEFVEGFGAFAELGPAIAVFGSARTPVDQPVVRRCRGCRSRGSSRRASPSSPAADRARWRLPTRAPARPAASASGSASSCPGSPASTSGSTSASTSATSSPARRCS